MDTQSDTLKTNDSAGSTLAALVFLPISVALWGLFVKYAWSWYAVPMGAPTISFAAATVLAFVIGVLTYHAPNQPVTVSLAFKIRLEIGMLAISFLVLWVIGLLS